MKISPIDEQLYKALCLVSNEMNDIMKHATENDFEQDNEFMRIRDAVELLDEYTSCFTADGEVSQRGEVPQVWNENTIFEASRMLELSEKQLTFYWENE